MPDVDSAHLMTMCRRWVYLAYIDSVKYFQPERPAAIANCALRTLVYHELLQASCTSCKMHRN